MYSANSETVFMRRNFCSQQHNQLWLPSEVCRESRYPEDDFTDIPLLGDVAAGLPVDIFETQEQVTVPRSFVRKNTYALKVRGDSMIEADIHDGDIIIIKQCETVENGETCVVMINNRYVTLKRLKIDRQGVRLDPANTGMSPIMLKNEDVQVLGIVMGLKRGHSLQ